jgi:hypothetical protein
VCVRSAYYVPRPLLRARVPDQYRTTAARRAFSLSVAVTHCSGRSDRWTPVPSGLVWGSMWRRAVCSGQ